MKEIFKQLLGANKIARYWHVEMFIFAPWMIWFSYEVYQIRSLLEKISAG